MSSGRGGTPFAPETQSFVLPWEPTAKGRPRTAVIGGRARIYTPRRTSEAEAALRVLLVAQGAQRYPRALPLRVHLQFRRRRPESLARHVQHPIARPDLDQYVKLMLDAGTGLLWDDDAQVVALTARKTFSDVAQIALTVEVVE